MAPRPTLYPSAFLGLLLVAVLPALAGAAEPAPVPDYAAYQRLISPGPEHAALARQAGDYRLQSSFWFDPQAEPEVTALSATRRMILDGRVLELEVEGRSEKRPFRGHGTTGYDNSLGRHWYVWSDTASTGVAVLYGTLAADGTGVLEGEVTSQVPGERTPLRIEIRRDGASEVHRYFSPGPNGREWRWMELVYTPAG